MFSMDERMRLSSKVMAATYGMMPPAVRLPPPTLEPSSVMCPMPASSMTTQTAPWMTLLQMPTPASCLTPTMYPLDLPTSLSTFPQPAFSPATAFDAAVDSASSLTVPPPWWKVQTFMDTENIFPWPSLNCESDEVDPIASMLSVLLGMNDEDLVSMLRSSDALQAKIDAAFVAIRSESRPPVTLELVERTAPEARRKILGESLYPLVAAIRPEYAEKITGMLLELENAEVLHFLESKQALQAKAEEAYALLQAHRQKEENKNAPCDKVNNAAESDCDWTTSVNALPAVACLNAKFGDFFRCHPELSEVRIAGAPQEQIEPFNVIAAHYPSLKKISFDWSGWRAHAACLDGVDLLSDVKELRLRGPRGPLLTNKQALALCRRSPLVEVLELGATTVGLHPVCFDVLARLTCLRELSLYASSWMTSTEMDDFVVNLSEHIQSSLRVLKIMNDAPTAPLTFRSIRAMVICCRGLREIRFAVACSTETCDAVHELIHSITSGDGFDKRKEKLRISLQLISPSRFCTNDDAAEQFGLLARNAPDCAKLVVQFKRDDDSLLS